MHTNIKSTNMKSVKSGMLCIAEEIQLSKSNLTDNYLVLESNYHEGYYINLPLEKNTPEEHHLFLLSQSNAFCFQDKVIRTISSFEREGAKRIHVYPGTVSTQGGSYNLIRFRPDELDEVMNLLPHFKARGIEFVKAKRFAKQSVVVQYKRMVNLEELKQGIFVEKGSKHIYYLPMVLDMDFSIFKKLVIHVRNNCDYKHFECSLAYSIDSEYKIQDYAKIYSPNCETDRLKEFNDHFEKAAKHFHLI